MRGGESSIQGGQSRGKGGDKGQGGKEGEVETGGVGRKWRREKGGVLVKEMWRQCRRKYRMDELVEGWQGAGIRKYREEGRGGREGRK